MQSDLVTGFPKQFFMFAFTLWKRAGAVFSCLGGPPAQHFVLLWRLGERGRPVACSLVRSYGPMAGPKPGFSSKCIDMLRVRLAYTFMHMYIEYMHVPGSNVKLVHDVLYSRVRAECG